MTDPTAFGRVLPLDPAWLARLPAEPVLEPELAIIDTHHHPTRTATTIDDEQ
jgi:hypothetical protein